MRLRTQRLGVLGGAVVGLALVVVLRGLPWDTGDEPHYQHARAPSPPSENQLRVRKFVREHRDHRDHDPHVDPNPVVLEQQQQEQHVEQEQEAGQDDYEQHEHEHEPAVNVDAADRRHPTPPPTPLRTTASNFATRKQLSQQMSTQIFYYPWYGSPEHDGKWIHWNHQRCVKCTH